MSDDELERQAKRALSTAKQFGMSLDEPFVGMVCGLAEGALRLLAERDRLAASREALLRQQHDELLKILELQEERDKLQAFKDWVHAYLDGKGIPHHPPGTHGAAGCRIGDRMDWVWAERDRLAATAKSHEDQLVRIANAIGKDARHSEDGTIAELVEVLAAELAELREWKRQMLAVESEWDEQSLAKMLGVPLGESCRKGIAERVPLVLKELAELRAACEPFAKWWQEAVDNIAPNALENAARRPIAYEGRYHGPTLGDCRRIAALLARTPETPR